LSKRGTVSVETGLSLFYKKAVPRKEIDFKRRARNIKTTMAGKKKKRRATKVAPEPKIRVAISKYLKWVEPYLRRAKKRMPMLILPRRIRSYLPPLKKEHLSWGSCDMVTRTITLSTHKIIVMKGLKRSTKKQVALSDKEILMTLAHELAHFRYAKHGYEQESYGRIVFHAMGVTDVCPVCNGKGEVPAEYRNE
jgi:hypothetical protein